MIKRTVSVLAIAALALQVAIVPARAEMSDGEKAAAALAILGIAALAHNKHHYEDGYAPADGVATAEFERGYRDGVHGYPYWEGNQTPSYAKGYQAGDKERQNSMAHRQQSADTRAPHMANQGCAQIVAQNFGVSKRDVHLTKSRPGAKHEWMIEAAVGHDYMTCTMRDSGEVLDLRGGRL